jgi:polyisoprenoid-binding protein YceI
MLAGHLKDTSFFFVAEYPTIKVSVTDYNEGKLSTVISVRGVEIKQQLPVTLKQDESSVSITGKFNVNLASLKMKGMEPDPESGEKIQDEVAFDLNLVLKK